MVFKKKLDKRGKEYWKLARNTDQTISEWPQWKQDYHKNKKADFVLLEENPKSKSETPGKN